MRSLFAFSLLALAVPAAQAEPIRFDFSVSLSSVWGIPPGTGTADGSGYVVFDSELANSSPGSRVGDMNTPLPTIDLSFDWLGMHFDESNGTLGALYVDGLGGILGWSLDGILSANRCRPAFQCVQWGTTDFNILAFGIGSGSGSALLTQEGADGFAVGSVAWRTGDATSIPEPGSIGLLALGLVGMALRRRKAAAA